MGATAAAELKRPYSVALTGGIASGKSTVSDTFAELGAGIIDTDLLAREVVAAGSEGLAAIVAAFGPEVLSADGELDRARLRRIVFADEAARRALESITHPRIHALVHQRLAEAQQPYVVVVVPLLVENLSSYGWTDRILVVDVDPALQKARLLRRDGVDESLANAMMEAQSTRQQRFAIADDVVLNDSSIAELRREIRALHREYLYQAQARGD